jgi:hypothetical protein
VKDMILCEFCGSKLSPEDFLELSPRDGASLCQLAYDMVLANSYSKAELRETHQLLVDCYAVQHSALQDFGGSSGTALSLMTLYLFCEEGISPGKGSSLHQSMAKHHYGYSSVTPPTEEYPVTIEDVLKKVGMLDYTDELWRWARSVWQIWTPRHMLVREWIDRWQSIDRRSAWK